MHVPYVYAFACMMRVFMCVCAHVRVCLCACVARTEQEEYCVHGGCCGPYILLWPIGDAGEDDEWGGMQLFVCMFMHACVH